MSLKIEKKYTGVLVQLVLWLILVLFFGIWRSWFAARAVLLGGSCWFFPSLYSWYQFRHLQQEAVELASNVLVKKFLRLEASKWIFSIILLMISLVVCRIEVVGFLSGYILIVISSLLCPLIEMK